MHELRASSTGHYTHYALSPMLPLTSYLFFLLLLLLSCCCTLATSDQDEDSSSLKLPLRRAARIPSLPQALILDSLRLSSSPNSTLSAPVVSGASSGSGQYLVDLLIGTPLQPLRLVADTGSDLVWAHCSPCRGPSCPLLHPPGSSFLPRLSHSFSPFHCSHPTCRLLPSDPSSPSCTSRSPCRYRYSYADRTSSSGFFSHDTLTASRSRRRRRHRISLQFGCAFRFTASPSLRGARGVLGLGLGHISFPSQAARRLRLPDRFSYCLADYTLAPPPTTFLHVGGADTSPDLRFTPLEQNPLFPTFYYIRILSAAVDGAAVRINPAVWALDRATGGGGTIVDSGTTLTFLPALAYRRIVKSIRRRLPPEIILPGPPGFDLCVNSSAAGLRYPRLGFRLLGGVEMLPPPENYFVDGAEGMRCLALQPVSSAAGGGSAVIGNLMQQRFLLVFDREKGRLGFARTGCGVD